MSIRMTPIGLNAVLVTTLNTEGTRNVTLTIHREDADPEHRLLAYRLAATYFGNKPSPTPVYVIQAEDGETFDVTDNIEWARWLTQDHEDMPTRTFTTETLWSGPPREEWVL